jgi:hypothetical protein
MQIEFNKLILWGCTTSFEDEDLRGFAMFSLISVVPGLRF